MQVQNWMNAEVISVEENAPVIQVIEILKQNKIKHLPVLRRGKLIGLITDQDIKEVSPAKSETLNAQELYYLLAQMKAKDVMHENPVIIRPDDTVEIAAVKMLEHNVTGLPVVTEKGDIVGILSQGDVLRVLISITGVYQRGVQFAFNLEERPGSIKDVADVIRDEGGRIVSILSTSDTADEGYRHVFIRIRKLPEDSLHRLIQRLKEKFMVLYMIEDPLKEI